MSPLRHQDPALFVHWMREASPYLRAHRGRTFVVYFGGEAVAAAGFAALVQDLALLCGIGVKLVVIHGTRPQIEARLAAARVDTEMVGHLRVTDARALEYVKDATAAVRYAIEAQFAHATRNRPLGGAPLRVAGGGFVTARPAGIINGTDLQFTGEIRKIDAAGMARQLESADAVLVSPLGYSPTGEIFSLNALDLATTIACEIKADKLVVLAEGGAPVAAEGRPLRQLTPREARELARGDGAQAHMFASALRACQFGVGRVHLVGAERDGGLLLELFTRDGVGTLISNTPFDQLRRASIDDVGGILALIEPLEAAGVLVKRSREKLEVEIDHFWVVVRDGVSVGCAALYPFPDAAMGEIACVAVEPDYRRAGFGHALLAELEQRAAEMGLARTFVLTTQTSHWFLEHGYQRVTLEQLPMERQALYNFQRNSQVLVKTLR